MRSPRVVGVACALALVAGGLLSDLAAGSPGPEAKAARRRWALAKMDEMANERLRCGERFQKKRELEACEAEFARKFRQYNEMYLEAARD